MPSPTTASILFGILLIIYGGYSFAIAEVKSPTALIPAFFGAALLGLGLVAMKDKFRKHAMHAAAAVGLIGFLGGAIMGFPKLPKLINRDLAEGPANAAKSQNLLAFVCLIFVIVCVNSFIQARKARQQAQGNSTQPPK